MPTATSPPDTLDARVLLGVLTKLKKGDFTARMPEDWTGIAGKVADTLNEVIETNQRLGRELDRVGRTVGKQGKTSQRLNLGEVGGGWATAVDTVNELIEDLVRPTSDMARVIGAVANGDLSQTIPLEVDGRPLEGQFLRTAKTVNTMVSQLDSFAAEVTRVAGEVGTEGKLGGQARVRGVGGVWKDLTDNVNSMAGNLTAQVRNIAEVTTAVARGDLSKKITVDVRGEILELKNTINVMVDQLNGFASEVTRVAREVGSEGKLGGQAKVEGVGGVWKDLTDNVNMMAGNLTGQVRNIAEVTTAVANGDLSKKITVDVRGEILELKNTVNVMVDQLNAFASEVTRVAREVGSEGKLGGQAEVRGVGGVWKDLTDNVNFMASNLTGQVRNIADVTTAVANGDLSKKITVDVRGEILELKNTINVMVDQLNAFASEVTRVAREVGTDGKLGGQAQVRGVGGVWKDLTDNVNFMASNLTGQVRNIAEVTTAVANGDLSKKITVDVRGELLELKNTINVMVDQLNNFASEVTRVAREVGSDGKLGGQAQVRGVAGVWKDLTDNVNMMAGNLTDQVRGIARVVTAVADGDLKRKLIVEAKGEVAALADTINNMTDTLATFADQVTTVAREVGVEGKLGGQANVPGAAGTWRDLTDNVNQLAANLTTQVRAIADVAIAVTEGDLTRSIAVVASGEVAVLKDNVNAMIRNLRETTQRNTEQDWLKTNLARFTRMLQGQRDLLTVSRLILSELAPLVGAQHGVFYTIDGQNGSASLRFMAGYGYKERKHLANEFRLGEGLIGQCALEKERILLTNVPDDYIRINSGLGEAKPLNIVTLPVVFEGSVRAVVELASFERFSVAHLDFLDQLTESIGIVINTIEATMRTESLLEQSQRLAQELQSQQDELQQTNDELAEKARLLAEQNAEVERKNAEVEAAKLSLEEKAAQLALTSKYKSEFLANMSHELRTPLNSLLILAEQLAQNPQENLSPEQVEYATIIRSSGNDLLNLINDILDLSKIESGTVALDVTRERFTDLRDFCERAFRHVAEAQALDFAVEVDARLPEAILTDPKRLQQILRNLLSNAFKFTEKGSVKTRFRLADGGWSPDETVLTRAGQVVAVDVVDTGIGIPKDRQRHIFEAFQQADGTTSRRYGGTGLGLSISRELARLLEGEIIVDSEPGRGSTFTVYLPISRMVSITGPVPHTIESTVPAPVVEALTDGDGAAATRPGIVAIRDDRYAIEPGDRVVLIVEDDANFARVLADLAHERGLRAVVATHGGEALQLAKEFGADAITLDLLLQDVSGWTVLDQLQHDPVTKHIPVHIVSVQDEGDRGVVEGASTVLTKPAHRDELQALFARIEEAIEKRVKHLLVIEDDSVQRQTIVDLLYNGHTTVRGAGSGENALQAMREQHFDCVVLDLGLPDTNGFDLLEKMKGEPSLRSVPVVVYTAGDLARKDETRLRRLARSIVLKEVRSPERLLEEVNRLLQRVAVPVPVGADGGEPEEAGTDAKLAGRKVLIVDDDVRNIFALTAALERHGLEVVAAESGRDAVELIRSDRTIDIALIDVMMPEFDGYETMRAVREVTDLKDFPMLAVTAKAMKGDRDKCLEAGANDYIPKPVDTSTLLSMLRVWLRR